MFLGDLPIGARIKDYSMDTVFLVAAHDHPGYEGTTLITDNILRQACFDAIEPENPADGRRNRIFEWGNNNYAQSNIHQWLNANGTDWFKPQHPYDMPPAREYIAYGENPYDSEPGFLTGFSEKFLSALQEVDVECSVKLPDEGVNGEKIRAKVFLLSPTELGRATDDDFSEGTKLPIFHDPRYLMATLQEKTMAICEWKPIHCFTQLRPGMSFWYWLRSPHERYGYLARFVNQGGTLSWSQANNSRIGIRCALNLDSGLEISEDADEMATHTILT